MCDITSCASNAQELNNYIMAAEARLHSGKMDVQDSGMRLENSFVLNGLVGYWRDRLRLVGWLARWHLCLPPVCV